VRAVRLSLIVAIGVASLASGILPPEHLHHSLGTRPPVVHSHFEAVGSTTGFYHPSSFNADEDDHHTAVDIERVMAGGPRAASHRAPALVPAFVPLPTLHAVLGALPARQAAGTPSPTLRLAASRAPPS
jgi:hypothetical protein